MMGDFGSWMMGSNSMGFGLLCLMIWIELVILMGLAIAWLWQQLNK